MEVQDSDRAAADGGSPPSGSKMARRRLSLTVYGVGFVAVFVLAAGAGLGGLDAAGQLSDGLLVLTLTGLLVFIAASWVFYRRVSKPALELSDQVRDVMTGNAAGPLTVGGSREITSLASDINQLITQARADAQTTSTLAAIVGSSADAIIGKTLDGTVTTWNAAAERQYGYTADEIIGRSVSLIIPPGLAEELVWILDHVRQGELIEHLETKRCRKDGTILDVSISVSPVLDADGAVAGAATVARDMTQRARLEADRREMERQHQRSQRLESLGQMAGGIAHDFNNLLNVIMNYTGFVAQQTVGDPAVQADLEHIQGAADRAARITSQLLIVGRRDTKAPEVLELNAIIADAYELLSSAVGATIEIRVNTALDLPAIKADRGQVEQVLLNLAVNARDAMPNGGTLTIATGVTQITEQQARIQPVKPGRYVELVVSDTGNGMSADVAARIFDPFFTTKPAGQGTGLGLATVHGVILRAGGNVRVESEAGTGTTFRILLPAVVPVPATTDADVPSTPGNGQTVLVVDDEPAVLQLTARILRQNGYTTLEAGTYEEALSLASSQDLQLLLTDSVMPHMSGPTLAEHITHMKPGTPVLYMSGHSTEVMSRGISDDKAKYLQKPFSPQVLLEKVSSALSAAPKPSA